MIARLKTVPVPFRIPLGPGADMPYINPGNPQTFWIHVTFPIQTPMIFDDEKIEHRQPKRQP